MSLQMRTVMKRKWIQYQEFIDNFTMDLKYVLLCIIDLIRTEEEKEQLRFENIINILLQDHQKYFYINDNYLLKVLPFQSFISNFP